jgi:hypothetical protein
MRAVKPKNLDILKAVFKCDHSQKQVGSLPCLCNGAKQHELVFYFYRYELS